MNRRFLGLTRAVLCVVALFLSGCAVVGGKALVPGESSLDDVLVRMGQPAMRWDDPDGRVQLAYPHGPWGTTTDMVFLAPDGRVERVENALTEKNFARIQNDKTTKEEVLRILGPSAPQWTVFFAERNELAWEWRFYDGMGTGARFNVLFDATTGIVRSSFQLMEDRGLKSRYWRNAD